MRSRAFKEYPNSTLAGNLTIISSAANLIVLEVSKDEVQISFLQYLKVGFPVTLLTLAAGVFFYDNGDPILQPNSR
jgi:Na+/H+ antiporter NhaD/arsenite permease-like protein